MSARTFWYKNMERFGSMMDTGTLDFADAYGDSLNVERPVSPATTAAPTALEIVDVIAGQCAKFMNARQDVPLAKLANIVEEYAENRGKYVASSPSEKLVGIGQEAAEKIAAMYDLKGMIDESAAIIEKLVAERLAK